MPIEIINNKQLHNNYELLNYYVIKNIINSTNTKSII